MTQLNESNPELQATGFVELSPWTRKLLDQMAQTTDGYLDADRLWSYMADVAGQSPAQRERLALEMVAVARRLLMRSGQQARHVAGDLFLLAFAARKGSPEFSPGDPNDKFKKLSGG